MNTIKNLKWNLVLAALIYVGLGIVLLVWPDFTSKAICVLIGILLVGYGIFQTVSFFTKGEGEWNWAIVDLLIGLCALGLGVFSLLKPTSVLSVLPIALGAIVIVDSCVSMKRALQLRELGMEKWWLFGTLAILTAIFGLVVVFNPFSTFTVMVRIIGAVLIYEGVSDLVTIFKLSAYTKASIADLKPVEGKVVRDEDRGF